MNIQRIIFLLSLMLFCANLAFTQTYTISSTSINTCSGTLYDTGGAGGNYGNNESFTMLLCSDNGSVISLQFTQFNLAASDMLQIYNGAGTTNLLATGTGTSLNGQTISANVDCLTLVWTSNASGVAAGFAANINCATLCQGYTTTITAVPAITDPVELYLDICPGTTVNFTAVSNFMNNGSQGYTQSTANTTYIWKLNSGDIGQLVNTQGLGLTTLSYTFTQPGGYTLQVRSTDVNGCWNMGDATLRIRVSIPPNFAGTSLTPNPICPGETVTLTGQVQTNPWQLTVTDTQIVEECFYDNYEGTVCFQVNAFQPGQVITTMYDVQSFCINMEHSYIGDFYMYLRCPNGQEAMLHQYYNCNNAYFGNPNHSDNCAPGTGYTYCYSMSASQTVTSVCNSGSSVPAGTYLPLGTFADLIGCPINGEWCVRFFDNWGADDGTIFYADLNFSPNILPQDLWGFENSYVLGQNSPDAHWDGNNMIDNVGSIGTAAPLLAGTNVPYTFYATDDYGCTYDTTITVTVRPITDPQCCQMPNPSAGSNQALCNNCITLNASAPVAGNNGLWEQVSGPGTATFTNNTQNNTNVCVSLYGVYVFRWTEFYQGNQACSNSATVTITFNETFDPTITQIPSMCLSAPPVQVQAVDIGTLSCPTCPAGSFDPASGIFNPQLAGPGTYTITNTLSGPCVGAGTSSTTFTVWDEINIINFNDQECIYGTDPVYVTEWDMEGFAGPFSGNYMVNNNLVSGHFYATHPSATNYAYTITDVNGCSNIQISGFRDCDCPSAGTMTTLQLQVLCQGTCTGDVVGHNGNEIMFGNSMFEFMIHNGDGTPIAYGPTTNFCREQFNGNYNQIYYVSAIAGFNTGSGHPDPSGCYSVAVGTPVMWLQNPTPNAGLDRDTCGLAIRLNGSTVPDGMIGYWSSTCQFFPVGGSSISSPNMYTMTNECQICTFTWNIVNGQCTGSDDVTVNFRCTPNPWAGNDTTVCGTQVTLTGNQSIPGSNLTWSGNGVSFFPSTAITTTATISTFGTYQFTLTEQNGACWDQDQVNVTFVQGPTPTVTMNHDTVCGTVYNLHVYNVNGPGIWRVYDDGVQVFPTFINGTNASNPHAWVAVPSYSGLAKTYEFCWNETNSSSGVQCQATVCIMVTFAREPSASVGADNHAQICGSSFTLAADTLGSGWAFGTWIAGRVNAEFDDINSPYATATVDSLGSFGDSAHVEVPFLWVMNNYGCTSIDTMYVTFYKAPRANAGVNDSICGNEYPLQAFYSIAETPAYSPTGWWSYLSGPGVASISNQNQPGTNVTVSGEGIYRFVWRESNSLMPSCYSIDTVTIKFIEIPIINAGDDFNVCGQCTQLNATTAGFTGGWQPMSGMTWGDPNDPHTTVCSQTYGAREFIWQETNSMCFARDTVVVTFWRKPTAQILTDAADSTACGLCFTRLQAGIPGPGITVSWRDLNEPNANFTAFNVANPDTVCVTQYGMHNLIVVYETGVESEPAGFCTDTAGPLPIRFIRKPEANAGIDTLFCGFNGRMNAIPSYGTGTWTTPSTQNIVFGELNNPNTLITTNVLNNNAPGYLLVWTEDNTNNCTDKDTVFVIFARIPTGNFAVRPPKCFGEYATLIAVEDTLATYNWQFFGSHTDSVSAMNTQGGDYRHTVRWHNNDTARFVTLVTTTAWGCESPVFRDTIYEPSIPHYSFAVYPDTCMLGKGAVLFSQDTIANSFEWLDTEGTPITPTHIYDSEQYNIPTGSYRVASVYTTFNMAHYSFYVQNFGTAYCYDTLTIDIEPVGMIDAEFEVAIDIDINSLVAPNAEVWYVNLTDYDDVRSRCVWYFGDGTSVTRCDEQVEHVYTEAGCYEPYLVVMNRDLPECRDTARLDFCIPVDANSLLEIPNIFTPNGDGRNDFFQVKARTLLEFNGRIVNRWGRTVYEWTNWEDEQAGWDGKLSGGSDASPGVYFYIIKAVGIDEVEYDFQGPLHLMREK